MKNRILSSFLASLLAIGGGFGPQFASARSNGGQDNDKPILAAGSGMQIVVNGNTYTFSTTGATLPSQTGQSGKFLTTDGTSASWSLVPLTSGVSGVLPVANGGTAVTSYSALFTAMGLGTLANYNTGNLVGGTGINVNVGGGTITISATTIPIANGGTGQTTANSALNALLPSQTSNSGKFLTTDGTNTSWATAGGGLSPLTANQLAPTWTNATSFSMPNESTYDSTGTAALTKSSATTIIQSSNVVNGIATSAAFSGTVTTNGTTTVTGSGTTFTTEFVIGDVIGINGDDNYRIMTIPSNTSLTVSRATGTQSGAAFGRGGLATDTAYYLYAISQAAGANPGFLLTTRSVSNGQTLVDLPSGYTLYRQLPFVQLTDSLAGNITGTKAGYVPFSVTGFASGSAHIIWLTKGQAGFHSGAVDFFNNTSMNTITTSGTITNQVFTNAPLCVSGIDVSGNFVSSTSNPTYLYFAPGTSTSQSVMISLVAGSASVASPFTITVPTIFDVTTNTNLFYTGSTNGANSGALNIIGYNITGIK